MQDKTNKEHVFDLIQKHPEGLDDDDISAMTGIKPRQQVQQLHILIDRRHKAASTIYCTQLPPGQWHDRMEEKILADAIIDRITTNAHVTVLNCDDSMRKHFNRVD